MVQLEVELKNFQSILNDACTRLQKWTPTSESLAKCILEYKEFQDIADGIDHRITAFTAAFAVARLSTLVIGTAEARVKETREKLDKWLKPVDIRDSQRNASEKRHGNTGQWFIESSDFKTWVETPSSFLWLHGISGSGKTVLSSTIIRTILERGEPHAFFYFDTATTHSSESTQQITVDQLLRSLVTQLSAKSPSAYKILDALWSSHDNGKHLLTKHELISKVLIPILQEFTTPVYIILDALDECLQRTQLLNFITEIVDVKAANLRLLVTSRPEVLRGTELAARAVCISLARSIKSDITTYLNDILSDQSTWLYKRKDDIMEALRPRHGGGMFRLVTLKLEELQKRDGSKAEIDKVLKSLPATLYDFYDRILEKIKTPHMTSSVARAINWIIFGRHKAVAIDLLIDALAFNFDQVPLRFDVDRRMESDALLSACGGLISVDDDGQVRIAHASVTEYFRTSRPKKFHCDVSEQTAQHLIAQTCLAYLCTSAQKEFQLSSSMGSYSKDWWDFHVTQCAEFGPDPLPGSGPWTTQPSQIIDRLVEYLDLTHPTTVLQIYTHNNDYGGIPGPEIDIL
ncbi:hypothetical protein C8J56DRAFT_932629 [Mycena floridula]|nr:hypothetical protein C8J56DRAFT_932629 [Mycena floridula]